MQNLDNEKDAEESTIKINKWVSDSTNGKVKHLFTELNLDSSCVLVSCIFYIVSSS